MLRWARRLRCFSMSLHAEMGAALEMLLNVIVVPSHYYHVGLDQHGSSLGASSSDEIPRGALLVDLLLIE